MGYVYVIERAVRVSDGDVILLDDGCVSEGFVYDLLDWL